MIELNHTDGISPEVATALDMLAVTLEEQDLKLKILQGLCQEQTKRIDENRQIIARHTARIGNMITLLDKATQAK